MQESKFNFPSLHNSKKQFTAQKQNELTTL